MLIKTLSTAGFEPAMEAMRNPMNSWEKSDSFYDPKNNYIIGPNDKELSLRLQKAGPEHCKHLRMIFAWANIIMPRYFWNEADTYRLGLEKISCSTMHKLMARPLVTEDFEHSESDELPLAWILNSLNGRMEAYKNEQNEEAKKAVWREIIQLLPQSYLQKRTVCMSYAALRNIVRQRQGHKLIEWKYFIDWCKTLPNSWMIFDE